jgi:hypothetical protein
VGGVDVGLVAADLPVLDGQQVEAGDVDRGPGRVQPFERRRPVEGRGRAPADRRSIALGDLVDDLEPPDGDGGEEIPSGAVKSAIPWSTSTLPGSQRAVIASRSRAAIASK